MILINILETTLRHEGNNLYKKIFETKDIELDEDKMLDAIRLYLTADGTINKNSLCEIRIESITR